MKKLTMLFIGLLLVTLTPLHAQDFSVSMEDGHGVIKLTGSDTLEGNALLILQRDGEKGRAGTRYEIPMVVDSASTSSRIGREPRWFTGLSGEDQFIIAIESKKTHAHTSHRSTAALTIDGDQNENGLYGDISVSISGDLSIRHTRLEPLSTFDFKALRLHNGDFIPEDFISSWDLGNAEIDEHWDNVVAREFVDYTDLVTSTSRSLKSNGYGLNQILQLAPVKSTNLKSQDSQIALDPYQVVRFIPEAVHTYDYDGIDGGKRMKKTVKNYGMKYNQLIPVLIQAIQDQQEMILDMQAQIDELSKR